VWVIPVLVAVAILGFLAGHRRPAPAPEEPAHVAYESTITLEYPATWQRTAATSTIPGLAIVNPVLLAPGGDPSRAGLLSGQLTRREATPVPGPMIALMQGVPRTEIVDFAEVQAYRYDGLRIEGYRPTLELYVIPNAVGAPTALACYASPSYTAYLAQCEQMVAKLTPTGRASNGLRPEAAYSARVGAMISALDASRLALRRQMGSRQAPADVARLGATLAERMTTAAAAIRTLHGPVATRPAQATLVSSIERAAQAYRTLETDVAGSGAGGLAAARGEVDGAEAGIDLSLESFALLGYRHS
jgi:hypothetical protein